MRHFLFLFAVLTLPSVAAAGPQLLGPDDKPVAPASPTSPSPPPAAPKPGARPHDLKACVNPQTHAPIKCPPRMMAPQRDPD